VIVIDRDVIQLPTLTLKIAAGNNLFMSQRKISYHTVRISVRQSFIRSERLIDATSMLHYELEAPPV
jgi:hypothetical protein